MGYCHLGTPVPPPKSGFIGEWILNPESKQFQIGTSSYRYKSGTNILGLGINENTFLAKLNIREDGTITYY